MLACFHGIVVPSAVDTIIFKVVARHLFIRTIAIFSSWFTFRLLTFGSGPTYFIRMRHVLVPLHIVHTTVWFIAYQAGVAIVSHVNSVVSLDEMMRGEENLAFYTVTRRTRQMRRRWRQTRRRWRRIRQIWMDFDAFLQRNGTLMHIQRDHWPHTLTQHWPMTSSILRQLITYSWICKLGHTPHYYSDVQPQKETEIFSLINYSNASRIF